MELLGEIFQPVAPIVDLGLVLSELYVRDGQLYVLHWLDRDQFSDAFALIEVHPGAMYQYINGAIPLLDIFWNQPARIYLAGDDETIEFSIGEPVFQKRVPFSCRPSDDSFVSPHLTCDEDKLKIRVYLETMYPDAVKCI